MPYRLVVQHPEPGSDEFGLILYKLNEKNEKLPIKCEEDKSIIFNGDNSIFFKIDSKLASLLPAHLLQSQNDTFNTLPNMAIFDEQVVKSVKTLIKRIVEGLRPDIKKITQEAALLVNIVGERKRAPINVKVPENREEYEPEPGAPKDIPEQEEEPGAPEDLAELEGVAILEEIEGAARAEGVPEAKALERKEVDPERKRAEVGLLQEGKPELLILNESTLIDEAISNATGEIKHHFERARDLLDKKSIESSDVVSARSLIEFFKDCLFHYSAEGGVNKLHVAFILSKLHLHLFKLLFERNDFFDSFYYECLTGALKHLNNTLLLIGDDKKYNLLQPIISELYKRCDKEWTNYLVEINFNKTYLQWLRLPRTSFCGRLTFFSPKVSLTLPYINSCNTWMLKRLCALMEKYGEGKKKNKIKKLFDVFAALSNNLDGQLLKDPNFLRVACKQAEGAPLTPEEHSVFEAVREGCEMSKFKLFFYEIVKLFNKKLDKYCKARLPLSHQRAKEAYVDFLNSEHSSQRRLQRMLGIWLKDILSSDYSAFCPPAMALSLNYIHKLNVPAGEEYSFTPPPTLSSPPSDLPKLSP